MERRRAKETDCEGGHKLRDFIFAFSVLYHLLQYPCGAVRESDLHILLSTVVYRNQRPKWTSKPTGPTYWIFVSKDIVQGKAFTKTELKQYYPVCYKD